MPVIDMMAQPVASRWIDGALVGRTVGEPLLVELPVLEVLSAGEIADSRPIGVRIPPGAPVDALLPVLNIIELIVVEFPSFRDGRGFTLATTLRRRYDFQGDLRATGHVLPDQMDALRQCGFTTIETPSSHPPEQWRTRSNPEQLSSGPLLWRLLEKEAVRRSIGSLQSEGNQR